MAKTEKQMQNAFNTFETFTSASSDAARKGFERSVELMGEMNSFGKQNFAAMSESAKVTAKAFETMSTRAAAYMKGASEDFMSASRSVTSAKSVKEAMELQAGYAKSSFDRYVEELNAWTGLFATSMRDAVEPLNAQAGEFVAMMQRKA